jgi:hypothetical protein
MSPRWADHSEYAPAVTGYLIECMKEDRRPLVREVRELLGVGPRLASALLEEAGFRPVRGRPWPQHSEYMEELQELLRKRRGKAISVALVMKRLGVSEAVASALLDEVGLLAEPAGDPDLDLLPAVIAAAARGPVSRRGLAAELGVHRRRAVRLAERAGIEFADPGALPRGGRGSLNINAKLTHEDVVAIRSASRDLTDEEVRRDFPHVSRETISQIRNGRIWKHVQVLTAAR